MPDRGQKRSGIDGKLVSPSMSPAEARKALVIIYQRTRKLDCRSDHTVAEKLQAAYGACARQR